MHFFKIGKYSSYWHIDTGQQCCAIACTETARRWHASRCVPCSDSWTSCVETV